METNLAETQPGEPTAAPVTTDSAPVKTVETPAKAESEPEWFTKRFGEMTARIHHTESRAQAAERRAAELEQRLQQQAPKEVEKAKTLEDFGFDDGKYQEYIREVARSEARAASDERDRERHTQATAASRARKFQERAVAFEKDTPDYRNVAHYAPINDAVAEIIQDLESGPELAYYLGKHRDIALTLNDLPPHVAAVELGRIDARLSADKAAKAAALDEAKKSKAVSGAPPPAPKLDGNNAAVEKEPSEMTDKEFAKWRAKQIAQRR